MQWKVICPVFVTAVAFTALAAAQSSIVAPPAPGKPCLSDEAKAEIKRIKELNRSSSRAQDLPFDPDYFVGTWELEWDVPDSPFGHAGTVAGTIAIRHVEGCSYEGESTGEDSMGPFTSKIRVNYDPATKQLAWAETHSRGYTIVKAGRITGDPGGTFTHYWETPAVKINGSMVSLAGVTVLTSPSSYRLRAQISTDGGPYRNFGNPWIQKR